MLAFAQFLQALRDAGAKAIFHPTLSALRIASAATGTSPASALTRAGKAGHDQDGKTIESSIGVNSLFGDITFDKPAARGWVF